MYLTEHLSRRVGGPFRIRALDRKGNLLPASAVALSGDRGRMTGAPVGRETSRDGRWSYTLYGAYVWGGGAAVLRSAFLLAMDTVARRMIRVDLPQLDRRHNPFALDLRAIDGGRRLAVLSGPPESDEWRQLLVVDPKGLTVTRPARTEALQGGLGIASWALIGALGVGLGVGFALLLHGRRQASGDSYIPPGG